MMTSPCRWIGLVIFGLTWIVQTNTKEIRVVCYYTNWSVYRPGTAKFSPQNINPYLCTHLIYAFGGFTKENTLKPFDKYQDIEKGGYAKFTGLKTYNKNLKTMLAIGGWNEGSSRFSPMVANADRRKEFVKNSIKFLRQNHFDGLDLDWEYPSFRDGGKSRDRENYAQLVQELREEFDRESEKTGRPRLLLTMAVPAGIEYINKGYDIAKLTKYLDWMNILSYDYHSAFEPAVNHHSPLFSLEEESEYNYDTELNIDHTIEHYLDAGADPNKLVLGIPTYGRTYTLFNPDANEIGAPADGPGDMGEATRENGYLAYYEICDYLKSDDWTVIQPNPKAMGPYAYKDNQWVGFDDESIVRRKAEYVVEKGLGGIMFWSIDNDDFRGNCHSKPYPLIEAAKDALISASGLTSDNLISAPAKPSKTKTRTRGRVPSKTTSQSDLESDTVKNSGGRQSINSNTSRRRLNRLREKANQEAVAEENGPKTKSNDNKASRSSNRRRTTRRPATTSTTTTESSKNSLLRTPEPPTTPDPGSDFKCEDEGFFPHPRDCKKYFWCLSSGPSELGIVAHQFTCPSGLYFNKAADSCDYTQNVLCNKKVAKQTNISTTEKTTSEIPISTTRAPPKITAATSRTTFTSSTTPVYEYEDEYEYEDDGFEAHDEAKIDPEEDPRVIKELLELIKKAGGIEELEKQLKLQESGAVPSSGSTSAPAISRTLYEKVLSKASVKNDGKNKDNSLRYSSINRNRKGPQFDNDGKVEKETSTNRGKLQYTNILRQRSTTQAALEEAAEEKTSPSNSRGNLSPEYVTIKRERASVSAEEKKTEDGDEKPLIFRSKPNKVLGEDEEENVSVTSRTTEYVTLRRQRPTTSESANSKYVTIRGRSTTASTPGEEELTTQGLESSNTSSSLPQQSLSDINDSDSSKIITENINILSDPSTDKQEITSSTTDSVGINSSSTENDTVDIFHSEPQLIQPTETVVEESTPRLLDPRPFSFNKRTRPTTVSVETSTALPTKVSDSISPRTKLRPTFRRPTSSSDYVKAISRENTTPSSQEDSIEEDTTQRRGTIRFKLTEPPITPLRPSVRRPYIQDDDDISRFEQIRNFRPEIAAELVDLSSLTSADITVNRDQGSRRRPTARRRPVVEQITTTTTTSETPPLKLSSRPIPVARKVGESSEFAKSTRRVSNFKSDSESTSVNLSLTRVLPNNATNRGTTSNNFLEKSKANRQGYRGFRNFGNITSNTNDRNNSEINQATSTETARFRKKSRFTLTSTEKPSSLVTESSSTSENTFNGSSPKPVRRIIKRIRPGTYRGPFKNENKSSTETITPSTLSTTENSVAISTQLPYVLNRQIVDGNNKLESSEHQDIENVTHNEVESANSTEANEENKTMNKHTTLESVIYNKTIGIDSTNKNIPLDSSEEDNSDDISNATNEEEHENIKLSASNIQEREERHNVNTINDNELKRRRKIIRKIKHKPDDFGKNEYVPKITTEETTSTTEPNIIIRTRKIIRKFRPTEEPALIDEHSSSTTESAVIQSGRGRTRKIIRKLRPSTESSIQTIATSTTSTSDDIVDTTQNVVSESSISTTEDTKIIITNTSEEPIISSTIRPLRNRQRRPPYGVRRNFTTAKPSVLPSFRFKSRGYSRNGTTQYEVEVVNSTEGVANFENKTVTDHAIDVTTNQPLNLSTADTSHSSTFVASETTQGYNLQTEMITEGQASDEVTTETESTLRSETSDTIIMDTTEFAVKELTTLTSNDTKKMIIETTSVNTIKLDGTITPDLPSSSVPYTEIQTDNLQEFVTDRGNTEAEEEKAANATSKDLEETKDDENLEENLKNNRNNIFKPAADRPRYKPKAHINPDLLTSPSTTTKSPRAFTRNYNYKNQRKFKSTSRPKTDRTRAYNSDDYGTVKAISSFTRTTERNRKYPLGTNKENYYDEDIVYDDNGEYYDEESNNNQYEAATDPREKENEEDEPVENFGGIAILKSTKSSYVPYTTQKSTTKKLKTFGYSRRNNTEVPKQSLNITDIDVEAINLRNKNLFNKKRTMNTPHHGSVQSSTVSSTTEIYSTPKSESPTEVIETSTEIYSTPEIETTTDRIVETATPADTTMATTIPSTDDVDTTENMITLHHIFAETESSSSESSTTNDIPLTENVSTETNSDNKFERLIEVNRIVEVSSKDAKVKNHSGTAENSVTRLPIVDRIGQVNRLTVINVVEKLNGTNYTNADFGKALDLSSKNLHSAQQIDPINEYFSQNTKNGNSENSKSNKTVSININGPNILTEVIPKPILIEDDFTKFVNRGFESARKYEIYGDSKVVDYSPKDTIDPITLLQQSNVVTPSNEAVHIVGLSNVNTVTPKPFYLTETATIPLEALFQGNRPNIRITQGNELLDTETSKFVKVRLLEQDRRSNVVRPEERPVFVPLKVLQQDEMITMKAQVVEITPRPDMGMIKIAPIAIEQLPVVRIASAGNPSVKEQSNYKSSFFTTKIESEKTKVNLNLLSDVEQTTVIFPVSSEVNNQNRHYLNAGTTNSR